MNVWHFGKRLFSYQVTLPKFVGAYYYQVVQSMTVVGLFNTAMIATLAWDGGVGIWVRTTMPWISFPIFATTILLVLFGLYPAFHRIFILATVTGYINRQTCAHDNPSVELIRNIQLEVKETRKEIAELKDIIAAKEFPHLTK